MVYLRQKKTVVKFVRDNGIKKLGNTPKNGIEINGWKYNAYLLNNLLKLVDTDTVQANQQENGMLLFAWDFNNVLICPYRKENK